MHKLSRLIARCSCGTSFYDSPGGWLRMVNHTEVSNTKDETPKHHWVEVTDLVIVKEVAKVD